MELADLPPQLKLLIANQLQHGLPLQTSQPFDQWRDRDRIFSTIQRTEFKSDLIADSALDQLLTDGIAIVDDFLPSKTLSDCLKALNRNCVELRPAKMNSTGATWSDRAIRGDEIRFLSEDESLCPEMDAAVKQLQELADDVGKCLGLKKRHMETQLARYSDRESKYEPHIDSTDTNASGRVITFVLYLSGDDWKPADGGCLRLHLAQGTTDIIPRSNRLVLFASKWLVHEVRPVYRTRSALSAFIHYEK